MNRTSSPISSPIGPAVAARRPARTGTLLLVACLVQLLVVLDNTIVNIALPSIDRALGFSAADLSWVVNAYVLVFGGMLLLGGRIADLIGLRRALLAGLVVFALASVAGGTAQNAGELIAARAVQGLAGALLAPVSLTLIMVTFTDQGERRRALTFWAMVSASGAAIGVLLGGVLTQYLDWRWVLFVNVPIAALAIPLTAVSVHLVHRGRRPRLDVPGAVLGTGALSALVYGLLSTDEHGWASLPTIGMLAVAVMLAALFVAVESRTAHPLVRLRVFAEGDVGIATVITLCVGAATVTGSYFASLYLQNVLHYGALRAGACFIPFCAGIVAGSFGSRGLVGRIGTRPVVGAGLVVGGAGLTWFAAMSPSSTFWNGFLGPSLVASVGLGAAMVTTTTLATAGVDPQEAGLVSGIVNAARQVGGSVGLATMTTVALAASAGAGDAASLARGYDRAFLVTGLLVVLAGIAGAVFARRVRLGTDNVGAGSNPPA